MVFLHFLNFTSENFPKVAWNVSWTSSIMYHNTSYWIHFVSFLHLIHQNNFGSNSMDGPMDGWVGVCMVNVCGWMWSFKPVLKISEWTKTFKSTEVVIHIVKIHFVIQNHFSNERKFLLSEYFFLVIIFLCDIIIQKSPFNLERCYLISKILKPI